MSDNEVVVRIPHSLGAQEARKRIADGVSAAQSQYGQFLHAAELAWDADRLNFRLSALAQTIRGSVEVQHEFVELRAQLPLVIRLLAKRFLPVVSDKGHKLLK